VPEVAGFRSVRFVLALLPQIFRANPVVYGQPHTVSDLFHIGGILVTLVFFCLLMRKGKRLSGCEALGMNKS
jgi:hypothetical protein